VAQVIVRVLATNKCREDAGDAVNILRICSRRKLKTEKERSGTDSLERVSDGNSRLSEDRLAKRLALVQSELYLERSRRFFYHVLDRLISLC